MATFALEEFVGNGALVAQLDTLIANGWADVPTLKVMTKTEKDILGLTQQQRVCMHACRRLVAFHGLNWEDRHLKSLESCESLITRGRAQCGKN